MNESAPRSIRFSWDIHFACNYRCPYCWFEGKWDAIASNNTYPGTRAIAQAWQRVHERYGRSDIQILGGEPLTYPDFPALVGEIARWHSVGITTNLSVDPAPLIALPERLHIGMSFHPASTDLKGFLARAKKVRESGRGETVYVVAWPPFIADIASYRQVFESEGLSFHVYPFWGDYQGRPYPASYSPYEKTLLRAVIGSRGESGAPFQLEPFSPFNRLCNAGRTYALVHPNGDVYRCGGMNPGADHRPISNLFKDDFALLENPQPCRSLTCACNEWSFLLVEQPELRA